MRILLLSAYDAASHRYWHQGLTHNLADIEWTVLTLPARHFSWRIRGNSLSWAYLQRQLLEQPYDALVATSMVDLASLRGLVPALARLPALVYFHENQFVYPLSEHQDSRASIEPQMVNLYTALCADTVMFNSAYNRDTFLQGVEDLLRKLPDFVPDSIMGPLQCASVMPVPLHAPVPADPLDHRDNDERLWLLWNHRWEHDKGPDGLLRLMQILARRGLRCRVSIVGEQFRRVPPQFAQIRECLEASPGIEVMHWGYLASQADYESLLRQADVVLSTALHEFQGLAVQQAIMSGCSPLLPARLAYPEYVPPQCLYPSIPEQPAREAEALAERLVALAETKSRGEALPAVDLSERSWPCVSAHWRALLEALC